MKDCNGASFSRRQGSAGRPVIGPELAYQLSVLR